jgi:hypothetical protein
VCRGGAWEIKGGEARGRSREARGDAHLARLERAVDGPSV